MDIVPEKISFPAMEEEIQSYWEKIDAFQTSLKLSEGKPEYSFYDGPPFATGLPHYGHILAGTIKDIVTRFAHQTGHHVVRRFGWDTHGLPIEFEIDKELGIRTKQDVLKLGIPQYNAACRKIVMRYSKDWERIVKRLGRWIDFQNDYKTLDASFMESVWWVFKQIFDKGLVYRSWKVMPYSTGCTTPISNFEASMNYKDVDDPSLVVSFPLESDSSVAFVAWTTTPWTLPSNLALCVHPELDYVKVQDLKRNKIFILGEARLSMLFADENDYKVLQKYKGKELEGLTYVPLFNYFEFFKAKGAFRVVCDAYVTSEVGTCIVHQAPAFGEDDYRVCMANGIITKQESSLLPCPIDDNGFFTEKTPDLQGKPISEANKIVRKAIVGMGRLIVDSTLKHSYPFCWRSETPLLYRAVPSWFVAVENIKAKLLVNNQQTYWVPDFIRDGRFLNWLKEARDWAVSRNRYWGTPIPIWASADFDEIVCVGSVDELEKLSGVRVTDLHRENIDHITIPSKTPGRPPLKRVEEVFDCWFESGSMPYAQVHYPFENRERFEKTFPADFIAEGIDQCRGWFYTLMVLSTALFDKPAFKNLIVNGLVLASDGKKMSKRLKNYPDPVKVVDLHGADSLRLYLINSAVVRGDNLRFQEQGVKDVVKDLFLPWFNAYRFFVECAKRLDQEGLPTFKPDTALIEKATNVMDRWILAATQSLVKFVKVEMSAYRLYTVLPRLVKFIDQLTNWYVRFNRKRLKGESGMEDRLLALNTLFEVLLTTIRMMSPFTPFFTEYVYQNLKKILPEQERADSIHFTLFPEPRENLLNERIEEAVSRMQAVIELGRAARDRRKKPLKFPLKHVTVVHEDPQFVADLQSLKDFILEELNVRELIVASDKTGFVTQKPLVDDKLGKRLKRDKEKVVQAAQALTPEQIASFQQSGKIELAGHQISSEEMSIVNVFKGDVNKNEAAWDNTVLIVLNLEVDEALLNEGYAREVINRIQKLRKKVHLQVSDPIEVFYDTKDKKFEELVRATRGLIESTTRTSFLPKKFQPMHALQLGSASFPDEDETDGKSVADFKFQIFITYKSLSFSEASLSKKHPQLVEPIQACLSVLDYSKAKKLLEESQPAIFVINDEKVALTLGEDVFLSADEKYKKENS